MTHLRDNFFILSLLFTNNYYETDLVEKLRTVRVIAYIDNSQLPAIAIFRRIASAKNRTCGIILYYLLLGMSAT